MCDKLPHVETLSSPDNYSFAMVTLDKVLNAIQPNSGILPSFESLWPIRASDS